MINTLIIAFISFLIGGGGGWVARGYLTRNPHVERVINVSNIVCIVILGVFTISILVSLVKPEIEVSPLLYGLMGSIVAFFFKKK